MLFTGKVAVVFGGSGTIGSAAAQAMACEGAHVCLGVRSQEKLGRTASIIRTTSDTVEILITNVLDEYNASKEVIRLVEQTDGIDMMVNATGFMHEQGKCINALSLSEFMSGITPFLSAQFNIAKAVTLHMGGNRTGVTFSVVASVAPVAMPGHLGHIVGCVGTEAFIKVLVSEAGPASIRVVGVCPHVVVDTVAAGSYTGEIFSAKAQSIGLTVDQWLGGAARNIMPVRLPTLAQIVEVMTFLASDHVSAMTVTVVNIAGGATHSRPPRIFL